jgi:multidrug transporter EmrE-like cation transporter
MLKTPILSIVFVAITSVLGAVGQFLFKSATETGKSFPALLLNARVLAGLACYLTVMVLFVQAFKWGGSVTVLYSIYASTFIWAAMIGCLFYQQPIFPVHVAGMALLVAGMCLMGL